MKKYILIFLLLCIACFSDAQDHIYSQFYNAPNYLNPALNGQFDGDLRMNMIYRNQWSQIPGSLNYYTFSIDYQIPKFGGGVGLIMTKSSEGTAYLNKINLAGIYSYSVELNNGVLSFGLQAGMTNSKIDPSKLIYLDQLGPQGIIPGGVSDASALQFNNRMFFDSGAGINLVYGAFMIGTSAQHINKPDQSFIGTKSPLPIRMNGYASYKYGLDIYDDENSSYVIPSVVVYNQAKITSYSVGCQYKKKGVNVGLWYRSDGAQQDAFVISFIFDIFGKSDDEKKIRFGISHDATTSKLPYTRTAGTTEGAFSYETYLNHNSSDAYQNKGNNGYRCYNFY